MDYVKLGRTGLEVSRIGLGCMSYGIPDRGNHAWSIGEAESRPFIASPFLLEQPRRGAFAAKRKALGQSKALISAAHRRAGKVL